MDFLPETCEDFSLKAKTAVVYTIHFGAAFVINYQMWLVIFIEKKLITNFDWFLYLKILNKIKNSNFEWPWKYNPSYLSFG